MRKLAGWALFLASAPVLTWWANGHNAKTIQDTITSNVSGKLESIADLQAITRDLELKTMGRDIRVSGHVLTDHKDHAVQLIKDGLMDTAGRRVVAADLEGHPAFGPKFTAKYDLGSGLSLDGFTTPDMDATSIASLLGADKASGNLDASAYGAFGAAKDKLAAIAPVLASDFDSASISVDGEALSLNAQVDDLADKEGLMAKLKGMLSGDDAVAIGDLDVPAGTTRINMKTGENEVFSGGYWLPNFEFDADLQTCQTNSNDALAKFKMQFVTGSAELDAESRAAINQVAGILIRCLADGNMSLEIAGHTDNVGDPAANLALSQERAEAVVSAIASRGIDTASVSAKGYGDTQPIASNDNTAGQALNRRTELVWSSN